MLFAAEMQVFNIHGDEGIGRAELTTMLSAIQQSTNTILSSVSDSDDAVMYGENREQAVKRMVDAAFKNCDITRTGKLLPLVSVATLIDKPYYLIVCPLHCTYCKGHTVHQYAHVMGG